MKKSKNLLAGMAFFTLLLLSITACNKDENDEITNPTPSPTSTNVSMGAHANATYGGFYSVGTKTNYTMAAAFQNQATVDLLCFYEAANGNNITVASPGSNITGIFKGPNSVELWTTKRTTRFTKTTLTTAQFDALFETDVTIVNSYDPANSFKKAKNLVVGDIYAFMTQDTTYGLFKVTEVVQDSIGYVKFTMKVKK